MGTRLHVYMMWFGLPTMTIIQNPGTTLWLHFDVDTPAPRCSTHGLCPIINKTKYLALSIFLHYVIVIASPWPVSVAPVPGFQWTHRCTLCKDNHVCKHAFVRMKNSTCMHCHCQGVIITVLLTHTLLYVAPQSTQRLCRGGGL